MEQQLTFSVVLPAYNERHRLPQYLERIRDYLEAHYPGAYELIVVDDGSTDGMAELLQSISANWPSLRVIRHEVNQGKGAAVRTGILASRGEHVLFADADGAAPIDQEARLTESLREGADIAIGSRLLPNDPEEVSRRKTRGLLGRMFAAVARRLLKIPVRDTQCGFKMFRGAVARSLFQEIQQTGSLFDLEVLGVATRRGWKIVEVPIRWTDVPGGHFHPIRQLPRILYELLRLWRRLGRIR